MVEKPKPNPEGVDAAVGFLPDSETLNIVPPDELEARLAEVRRMRKEEGWGDDGGPNQGSAGQGEQ